MDVLIVVRLRTEAYLKIKLHNQLDNYEKWRDLNIIKSVLWNQKKRLKRVRSLRCVIKQSGD